MKVGDIIQEELEARGWTTADLAQRMGGDAAMDQLCVDMLIAVDDKRLMLDPQTAEGLSRGFGVPAQFFMSLDKLCRASA